MSVQQPLEVADFRSCFHKQSYEWQCAPSHAKSRLSAVHTLSACCCDAVQSHLCVGSKSWQFGFHDVNLQVEQTAMQQDHVLSEKVQKLANTCLRNTTT